MDNDAGDTELQQALAASLESFHIETFARHAKDPLEPLIRTHEVARTPPLASPNIATMHAPGLMVPNPQGWSSPSPRAPTPRLAGQVLPSPRIRTPEPLYRVAPEDFPLGSHVEGQPHVLIAVMGPTGSGKTSLINLIAGEEVGKVGKGLQPGTLQVESHAFSYSGINFTLCDAPGFDDTNKSDTAVLRDVSDWLTQSYRAQQRLTAILYLSRISDPRMQGSPLRNFAMFKELCGADCFRNIVLGTTFWGQTDALHPGIAEQRERELMDEFWVDMLAQGSEVLRIPEERWLARELLVRLATKGETTLQTQRERVEEGRAFESTAAHRALNEERERLQAKHEEDLQTRQKTMEREFEERRQRQQREETPRTSELTRQLEEQRQLHQKLEQQRSQHETESKRLWEEAKSERERLESQCNELVQQTKQMAKDHQSQVRRRRGRESSSEVKESIEEIERAAKANRIRASFRELVAAYSVYCDNCYKSIGLGTYYGCPQCSASGTQVGDFVLCAACHGAPDVYCYDAGHFPRMEPKTLADTQGGCRRVARPPAPGVRLPCDGCGNNVGAVYFHCCACADDNYDLCLVCITTGKTCRNSSHGLDICVRQTRPV